MTGSGPTMVVLLEKPAQALSLQEEIKKAGHNWLSLITKTCTQEEVNDKTIATYTSRCL